MAEDVVISVKGLVKEYELYDKNIDQLKEIFSIRRKKYHRDFKALDNINFEVLRGEHLGIIGTNGSGKSTLLKILTGVVTPSSGKVLINGKISALLELGAGFNPNYTGMQNIYLNTFPTDETI
jgi:ABC-type polysaccharide/polyol phosphate transport system ATPase subunit